MNSRAFSSTRGSAVVALMLAAVIILGSMVMLHAAAVVTVGGTSRALEVARQNATTFSRLEKATREAAQLVYGSNALRSDADFKSELNAIIRTAPLGAIDITQVSVSGHPDLPRVFPNLIGPPAPLASRSSELGLLCNPDLLTFIGPRVSESVTFQVAYTYARKAVASNQTYSVAVNCRLVAVPLSRFAVMAYDLPGEIGMPSSSAPWPATIFPSAVGPRGLVPDRDPANINGLSYGQRRPEHYRSAAVLSDVYGYVFSQSYLQNAVDCAGVGRFVQIGVGTANPQLPGGAENEKTYTLDLAGLDEEKSGFGPASASLAVFSAISDGCSLVLTDSGASSSPILLVLAGPADTSVGPVTLTIASSLLRPVVLVCYHTMISAPAGVTVNGALLLDRDSSVAAAVGPLTVGHLSYWAGGAVSADAFRVGVMPEAAENLMPRAVYIATSKNPL